jgi:hypothetical protein
MKASADKGQADFGKCGDYVNLAAGYNHSFNPILDDAA